MIKFYFTHEYRKKSTFLRSFDVIPSITLNLYLSYKFESIRFSWLGFMFGFYFEPNQIQNP